MKRSLALAAAAALLAGCGGKFVHVRTGEDPRYQDDGVRFRTTYYFRVFDPCGSAPCSKQDEEAGLCRPRHDSLHRFRLTGKAGTFAAVHFEAGTLMAHEIDPFGSAVAYDENNNRFHFKSRHQTDDEVRKRDLMAEIRNLRALCSELKDQKDPADRCVAALAARVSDLQPKTRAANGNPAMVEVKTAEAAVKLAPPAGGQAGSYPGRNPACVPGDEKRRGFEILGPEGWRTFDQDERLILAMSSSGKPLIASLKEISERVLQQKSPSRRLETYLREQTAVERARQTLDAAAEGDEELAAVWQRLRAEMERQQP